MGDVAEGLEANLARAGLEQVHTKPELVTFKGYDVVRYSGRPMPVKAEGETEGPLEQVHTRPELCRPVVYEAVRYPGRPYQAPAALNEEPLVQVHTREA
jgi:ribonuclease E